MTWRTGTALFLLMAALFLAMNRGAYRGYFSDDEIDNISWTPHVPGPRFLEGAVTPRFLPDNFRPAGHYYFHVMERWFKLDFTKYVAALHLLHLLNAWLLWMLARRLGADPPAAALAVAAFAFHMALFDALWKPMYVFDVLCETFSLVSLLCWTHGRWVLSFAAFWLAYKSKELAVMLPAVLLAYEWLLGKRRWKPLVPFFAASLAFGLQGLLLNPNRDNDYTFRFTPAALAKTSVFYAGRVLLVPFAGFALLAAPWFTRNRRIWFGLAAAALLFFPLLWLPGRLYSAYCYVPFLGLAVALSAVPLDSRRARITAAVALLLWIPWDMAAMRKERRGKLARDAEVRTWVTTLGSFAAQSPRIADFVFSGAPGGFQRWGIEGAIRYFYPSINPRIRWVNDPDAPQLLSGDRYAMLTWDGAVLDIMSRSPDTPDVPYLTMNSRMPVWQLGEGWFPLEGTYRWIAPEATARLMRPPGARRFELRVNVGPDQLKKFGAPRVGATVGTVKLAPREFSSPGWQTARWDLPPGEPGPVEVRLDARPGFHPDDETRLLGAAIVSFGFVAEDR